MQQALVGTAAMPELIGSLADLPPVANVQGMVTTDPIDRVAAVELYLECGRDTRRTLSEARNGKLPSDHRLRTSSDPGRLLQQWVELFEQTCSLHDRPAAPRKRKVPDDVALQCADEMAARGPRDMSQAAQFCPTIAGALAGPSSVTSDHLLRHMHEVDPIMSKRRRRRYRQALTSEQQDKRHGAPRSCVPPRPLPPP